MSNKIFAVIFLISLLIVSACSNKTNMKEKYNWTKTSIEKIFKDSCINSDNWKNKDPAEVMEEDRSLQVTGFLDTSEYTTIPTAIVVGFCAIGEGGGWGNELFLVGHNSKLEQENYVIKDIFDESLGLTFSANMIKKEKDNLILTLEGYTSKSEPKCCRNAIDILEISFQNEIPKLNFVTNNSYQVVSIRNAID